MSTKNNGFKLGSLPLCEGKKIGESTESRGNRRTVRLQKAGSLVRRKRARQRRHFPESRFGGFSLPDFSNYVSEIARLSQDEGVCHIRVEFTNDWIMSLDCLLPDGCRK